MGKYEKTIYGKRWVSDKDEEMNNAIVFIILFGLLIVLFILCP